jgi:hypothetical protein
MTDHLTRAAGTVRGVLDDGVPFFNRRKSCP